MLYRLGHEVHGPETRPSPSPRPSKPTPSHPAGLQCTLEQTQKKMAVRPRFRRRAKGYSGPEAAIAGSTVRGRFFQQQSIPSTIATGHGKSRRIIHQSGSWWWFAPRALDFRGSRTDVSWVGVQVRLFWCLGVPPIECLFRSVLGHLWLLIKENSQPARRLFNGVCRPLLKIDWPVCLRANFNRSLCSRALPQRGVACCHEGRRRR
jgi:hypothetical protein